MKNAILILFMAAMAAVASAQTTPKTSTASTSASKSSSATTTATTKSSTATAEPQPWIKLPPGVPRVAHGPVKIPFSMRYEDIKVGAGAEGAAGKMWHVKYTGWRAADGVEFDSWEDHKQPVMGKDGKPELGPDGKPKMEAQPISIPLGMGRVIPGFDYGLMGMKIGGKRRLFIPWEMAYGTRDLPDRKDASGVNHPGIPAKSDLIFDVELVDVTELPQPPQRPMPPHPMPPHPGAGAQPNGTAPGQPAAPAHPATPANPTAPPTSAAPAQPTAPAQPSAQPAAPAQPTTPPQPK